MFTLFASFLTLASAASSGRTPSGEPVCRDGKWMEVTQEDLDTGLLPVLCYKERTGKLTRPRKGYAGSPMLAPDAVCAVSVYDV